MTVSSSVTKESLQAGNGSNTLFTFNQFKVFSESEVRVLVVNDSTGVETLQALTTDYTVSLNANGTGSVTMVTAPASGESVLLKRQTALTQLLDLLRGDTLPEEALEDALDKIVHMVQEVQEQVDRSITAAESTTASITLPAAVALKALRWNQAATALENGDLGVWVTGAGVPDDATDGQNGDMYLRTNGDVYGPKTSGAWGSVVTSLLGATGGSSQWLSGAGAPSDGNGNNGDMYLDTTANAIYGPKASGTWGSSVGSITDGADGVFSGSEATVTIVAGDKLALLDASDSDNPKFGLVSDIVTLAQAGLSTVPTGVVAPYAGTTAPSGWLLMDDGNIGSAGSGADSASDDNEDLFTLLWNADSGHDNLAILTSAGGASTKGASAAADWAANKRLNLPLTQGRAVAGAGSGASLTARNEFDTDGVETVSLTAAQNGPHTHTTPQGISGSGTNAYAASTGGGATSTASGASGSGSPHENMQPTVFMNFIIKQ